MNLPLTVHFPGRSGPPGPRTQTNSEGASAGHGAGQPSEHNPEHRLAGAPRKRMDARPGRTPGHSGTNSNRDKKASNPGTTPGASYGLEPRNNPEPRPGQQTSASNEASAYNLARLLDERTAPDFRLYLPESAQATQDIGP